MAWNNLERGHSQAGVTEEVSPADRKRCCVAHNMSGFEPSLDQEALTRKQILALVAADAAAVRMDSNKPSAAKPQPNGALALSLPSLCLYASVPLWWNLFGILLGIT